MTVYVDPDATVDEDAVLQQFCTVLGKSTIEKGAHIGAGVILEDAYIHMGARIGANSYIGRCGIGTQSIIEPGTVMMSGCGAYSVMRGNPAEMVGISRADLAQSLESMKRYMQTRSREFQAHRWDIVRSVIECLPNMGIDDWIHVYNMAISLLWQQHEDFVQDQLHIRRRFIDAVVPEPNAPSTRPSGKISWLINHAALGTYAPFKHVYAYLSAMPPCDVLVYGSARPREIETLREMGHTVLPLEGSAGDKLTAVRSHCDEDTTLITEVYLGIPAQAFAARMAGRQIYLSPGMQLFPADKVLLADVQAPIEYPGHNVETIPTAVRPEHLNPSKYRHQSRKAVFGILSRPQKMTTAFLRTVGEILDELPNTVFHIYGADQEAIEYRHERFILKGVQHFSEALRTIDVYLDSFPTCGGLSCYEAMAHGIPVLTLDKPAWHSWNVVKPCLVETVEAYKDQAIRLMTDNKSWKEAADRGLAAAAKMMDCKAGAEALMRAIS